MMHMGSKGLWLQRCLAAVVIVFGVLGCPNSNPPVTSDELEETGTTDIPNPPAQPSADDESVTPPNPPGGGASSDSGADPNDTLVPANPTGKTILVSIVMHVEEPPGYPDFENDAATFEQHRAALLEFAQMLASYEVVFNYQSDWNFLKAVARYDAGRADTNNRNIVRYLKDDLGFEIDPHAHETRYNYADVAYLIEQLGVTPSGVVGGFIVDPPRDSKLEQFWEPITGINYPQFVWQAQVLWGGGTGNHVNETALWTSGVWRPKDRGHFLEHDQASPLPNIGNFGGTWENLDLLVSLWEADLLADGIHTATVMTNQRSIVEAGFIEGFESELRARRSNPAIRWVGLSEVLALWGNEYEAQANTLSYDAAAAMTP